MGILSRHDGLGRLYVSMKRLLALGVFSVACGADPGGGLLADGGAIDAGRLDSDAGDVVTDGGLAADAGVPVGDGGAASLDAGVASPDAGVVSPDAGAASTDGGGASTDAGAASPDGGAASPDGGGGTTGAVCASGEGRALWRLTFPSNAAGYATVEEWDNGCDYSLADQACSLSGEPHDYANFGPGVLFNSSTDFFRVRFSAQGQTFTQATLYLSAHADGSGIPNAVLESPIYGSLSFAPTVPISTHRTYAVDWSDFLSPTDTPSLTAVTLRSNPTGLAVSAIELCVQ